MIDQDAITARVVARLEAEGKKLADLTTDELEPYIEAAFREIIAETSGIPVSQLGF